MFWESVGAGLGVLAYWQTYVAGLLFLLLSIGPMFLIGAMAMNSGRAGGAIGCLSMLALPFFQVFALVVFVLTLSPIILGVAHDAAWSFPWGLAAQAPWELAKFVAKLLVVAFVLAFIPIVGRFQTLHVLLLGSIALALVLGIVAHGNPALASKDLHFWPGFWFVLGILVVGTAAEWIGTLLAAFLAAALEEKIEGIAKLVVVPVAATFGFIPLFIYGAWLGTQVRGM